MLNPFFLLDWLVDRLRASCFLYFFLFFSYPSTFFLCRSGTSEVSIVSKAAKGQIGGMTNFLERTRSPDRERGRLFTKPLAGLNFTSYRESGVP